MGRSGGGHRSGGGGFHHSGGYRSSSYHHHHYYGGGGGYGHYYYGRRGNIFYCISCLIPTLLIIFVVAIVVVLLSDGSVTVGTTLTKCEQVISCPDSDREGYISVTSSTTATTTTFTNKRPSISKTGTVTTDSYPSKYLGYNEYTSQSFNLVAGSTLSYSLQADDYFEVYLVEGEDNYKKFVQDDGFYYVRYDYDKSVRYNYTAEHSAEYFVIAVCSNVFSYGITLKTQLYVVNHLRFIVEDPDIKISDCSETNCIFYTDGYSFPGPCVVVENPCDSGYPDDIYIEYNENYSGLFYACLVITILGGVGFVVTILLCIFCVMRGSKGSDGQTYQTVPATTAAPTTYPAGYQQPQAITPSYQQPVYTATTPAYTTVDSTAPAYVPYGSTAPPAY